MSDLKIVHAEEAFFDYDPRDARKILRVKTKLALNPATPGFDANARHDILQDIGKKFRGPNNPYGCDFCIIHASDGDHPIDLIPPRYPGSQAL